MTNGKKSCQYCRGKDSTWVENLNPMPDYDTPDELYGISVGLRGKDLYFNTDYPIVSDEIAISIKYCPFCGHELK